MAVTISCACQKGVERRVGRRRLKFRIKRQGVVKAFEMDATVGPAVLFCNQGSSETGAKGEKCVTKM